MCRHSEKSGQVSPGISRRLAELTVFCVKKRSASAENLVAGRNACMRTGTAPAFPRKAASRRTGAECGRRLPTAGVTRKVGWADGGREGCSSIKMVPLALPPAQRPRTKSGGFIPRPNADCARSYTVESYSRGSMCEEAHEPRVPPQSCNRLIWKSGTGELYGTRG